MRLNLRNTGLNISSAESDGMFDQWDDNKCGSLQTPTPLTPPDPP